ncbi:unnamed protein product [Gongylonema pulchrum]|uniref:Uncharacterized protein n=1 Tax=Gongylonema pulchrum TaxID=637853 RepID=A0A183ETD8_9BILA|nr:unnamed protein product [Gongylonema pulchrum]
MARYESKIKELRDMIDDALKEKTRVNMDAKAALAERDNQRARVCILELIFFPLLISQNRFRGVFLQ